MRKKWHSAMVVESTYDGTWSEQIGYSPTWAFGCIGSKQTHRNESHISSKTCETDRPWMSGMIVQISLGFDWMYRREQINGFTRLTCHGLISKWSICPWEIKRRRHLLDVHVGFYCFLKISSKILGIARIVIAHKKAFFFIQIRLHASRRIASAEQHHAELKGKADATFIRSKAKWNRTQTKIDWTASTW